MEKQELGTTKLTQRYEGHPFCYSFVYTFTVLK